MRIIATLFLTASAAFAANAADLRPGDFASTMPMEVTSADGLHVATLPFSFFAGSQRRDLGDVRVFNGVGETVPYSLLTPRTAEREKSAALPARVFPLWAQPGAEASELSVRIDQSATGAITVIRGAEKSRKQARLAGYLVDTSAIKKPMQAIAIEWANDAQGFAGRVDVASSDDLSRWNCCIASGSLIALQHEGQTLKLNRVELPRVTAKYLRLSWPASQTTPAFVEVWVEQVESVLDAPRTWHTVIAEAGTKAGEYAFKMNAYAPIDRLRVSLPNPNTVATVKLLARSKDDDPWHMVAAPTVYRLTRSGQDFVSPDIEISPTPERSWLLRLDPRTSIGQGMPKLTAGFIPRKIVFAARGAKPFELAYGNPKVASSSIPIATLVPEYHEDKPLEAASATLGEPRSQEIRTGLLSRWLDLNPGDWQKIALWSVLAAGVAILGWMAFRLGRTIHTK